MTDEKTPEETPAAKPDHEPPAGAETSATWTGGAAPIAYTARANWLVLRKNEKPAAEIFSVSYVADGGDAERPVMFVFNGGPGASSAFLHLGAVGPQRVAFPADGSLPEMPPRLVQNDESWLAFADLVFVDPVGTGFSRVIENDAKDDKDKKPDATDPKEYFGQKRDLESLCEFMGRWLSINGRWGSPIFIAGESYGGYRVGRLVRMLQESAGIGLNGAILISPALEIASLAPTDYEVLGWVDTLPTMAAAAAHHGRSRVFAAGTALDEILREAEEFATGDFAVVPDARRVDGAGRARPDSRQARRPRRAAAGSRRSRRRPDLDPHVHARAAPRRAEGARPLRRDDHRHRPVPRSRLVRRAGSDALRDRPGVHDGGQPAAPFRDRRRDRPRVHGAEPRGQPRVEGRHRPRTSSSRRSARPTTSATACRSTRT